MVSEASIRPCEVKEFDDIVTDENMAQVLSWIGENKSAIESVYDVISDEDLIQAGIMAYYYHHAYLRQVREEIESMCT